MVKVDQSAMLAQKKEKDVLMYFQKTKNCRDRKKDRKRNEEQAEKKREKSKMRYMKLRKNKVKGWESLIIGSQDKIRKLKDEIGNLENTFKEEETKIAKATAEKEKEEKKLKKKGKKK